MGIISKRNQNDIQSSPGESKADTSRGHPAKWNGKTDNEHHPSIQGGGWQRSVRFFSSPRRTRSGQQPSSLSLRVVNGHGPGRLAPGVCLSVAHRLPPIVTRWHQRLWPGNVRRIAEPCAARGDHGGPQARGVGGGTRRPCRQLQTVAEPGRRSGRTREIRHHAGMPQLIRPVTSSTRSRPPSSAITSIGRRFSSTGPDASASKRPPQA